MCFLKAVLNFDLSFLRNVTLGGKAFMTLKSTATSRWNPYNKTNALISQIYFCNKILHVSDFPLSIIRSFSLYTQQ